MTTLGTKTNTNTELMHLLRRLIPTKHLTPEMIARVVEHSKVLSLPVGHVLFKEGEYDRKTYYLLKGKLQMHNKAGQKMEFNAGTISSTRPVHNVQPRQYDCETATPCTVIVMESKFLDVFLTWNQVMDDIKGTAQPAATGHAGGKAAKPAPKPKQQSSDSNEDTGIWMNRVLQSKAFMQMPPANIQKLFMRMEEVQFKAGATVVHQEDKGDFYYIIKSGRCKVMRIASNREHYLATLESGDTFGEEALLTDAPRNATVRMLTDGRLMRLSKKDFNELLREPILQWVTMDQASDLVSAQEATWLDVRLESEHEDTGIKGSVNIPLFMLRLKADTLDPYRKYILYCDSGRRSSAGAFLLRERGVDAYCLRGGLHRVESPGKS